MPTKRRRCRRNSKNSGPRPTRRSPARASASQRERRAIRRRLFHPDAAPSSCGAGGQIEHSIDLYSLVVEPRNHPASRRQQQRGAGAFRSDPDLAAPANPDHRLRLPHATLINFVRPDWRWLPPATGMLTSLVALIILYPLLSTSPL